MRDDVITGGVEEPTLDQKVAFLSRSSAYGPSVTGALSRETHMSWVFLAGDRVYKLKKPVRFPYLDFSTLRRREAACRAELRLNRRLAPDVYLDVVPLTATPRGLAIGGDAKVVDWLVVMRRLDEAQTLEHAILEDRLDRGSSIGSSPRLCSSIAEQNRFSCRPRSICATGSKAWRTIGACCSTRASGCLRGSSAALPASQRRFLSEQPRTLAKRVCERSIVDGHGDLRPEHIWLGDPVRIIDCLEFNPRLRAVDPFDEIAFLSLECDRLGAGWAGKYITRRVMRGLRDGLSEELFLFYRCHRAMLRARLAIAHLLEPNPRTPDKWPRLARAYLRIAAADAIRLERSLKIRAGRPAQSPPPAAGSPRQASGAAGKHVDLVARGPGWQAGTAGTASVMTSRSMAGSARTSAAPAMNRPWVTRAITRRAPACSSCPCSAQQRASGADQVVDNQRGRSSHIADEEVARDHAGAAVLVGKRLADRTAERRLQRLAEQLRPLGAARIRRHDAESSRPSGPARNRRTAVSR